jgi:hypothetical protein
VTPRNSSVDRRLYFVATRRSTVSGDGRPGGGPGPETSPELLLRALSVRRKAQVGAAVGVAVGLLAYLLFVVVRGQPVGLAALYVVSVLVVATATAALVTVTLVVRTVLRATVDTRRWIRRGGTAATVAGTALAVLSTAGPAVGRVAETPTGSALAAAYGWTLPLAAAGLLFGVWAVHAAHCPRRGYGRVGLAGAGTAGVAAVLVWWVSAVDAGAFLGAGLERVSPTGFLTVTLALALGTTLLGAATLRARAMPTRGPLAALFALPVALAGTTVVVAIDPGAGLAGAYLDPPAPSTVALAVPTALAWALLGRDLRAGRGVPPESAFDVDLLPESDDDRSSVGAGAADSEESADGPATRSGVGRDRTQ